MAFPGLDMAIFGRGVVALESMASSLTLILGEVQEIRKTMDIREFREEQQG